MNDSFNFDEELRKLKEAHKAFCKAEVRQRIQEGFCFDAYLKEQKITQDEFYNYPEEKQEMIYAEYESRKWK